VVGDVTGARSYSQGDEQAHIVAFFRGDRGTFLDIGAYDGISGSNTYRLVELDWWGVCVEPSPGCFERLQRTHRNNRRVRSLRYCIGSEDREVEFWDHESGIASASLAFVESQRRAARLTPSRIELVWNKISVRMISVKTLLSMIPEFEWFDFVNIDAEGMDLEILQQLPLDELEVKLVCIEVSGADRARARAYLQRRGFRTVYENLGNLVAGR
jgi:FkbM family methyltransferase